MRTEAVGAALVFLAVAGVELATHAGTPVATTAFDSDIFLLCAEVSPFEARFWRAMRPPVPPLVYRLAGRDPETIRVVQILLSALAWSALGWALAREARGRAARLLAFFGPLLLALSIPVALWNGTLMSESITLSLLALTCAATLTLWRAEGLERWVAFGGWLLVWSAFALARDASAYLLLLPWCGMALALGRSGWAGGSRGGSSSERPRPPRGWLVAALVLGAAAPLFARASMQAGQRWHTPLLNVILQRILPDPELAEAWHARYGLPRNELLLGQAGRWAWTRLPDGVQLRRELESNRRLARVEAWLQMHGLRSLERHLLVDEPLWALQGALRGLDLGVDPGPPILPPTGSAVKSYAPPATLSGWRRALTALVYSPLRAPAVVLALALALAGTAALRSPPSRPLALLTGLLLAGAAEQAFVTWHGDAAEVHRHVVVVGVLARLGLVTLAMTLLDLWTTRPRQSE